MEPDELDERIQRLEVALKALQESVDRDRHYTSNDLDNLSQAIYQLRIGR